MYAPGAVLALCLSCFLNGNVFGYAYGEDYSDLYYNEIINGDLQQRATQSPCQSQDILRWDKLFIMLEDTQMRQNMLLQQSEDMAKVEMNDIRKELQKLSSNNNKACAQVLENTCKGIKEQMNLKLNKVMEQLREAADKFQAQKNETLQQLLQFSMSQATRLTKLESNFLQGVGLTQVAMKSLPTYPKEQEASSADSGKLERTLIATAADLQRVHAQLALFQRAIAHHYIPSGCEMALLFPMRSKHIFAEVTPSKSFSLRSFTICMWAKVTQSLNRTVLFSYGTRKNTQELQLLLARRSLLLTVGGETHLVEAHNLVTDGQWAHFCGAWSSDQGLATLWVNGERVANVAGVAEGHILPGDGFILLGQERSRLGIYKKLDSSVAFTGKMTGVNMWDHVLEAGRIKEYAKEDGSCDNRGNVIGWGVSEIIPHGGSQYIN
ncbi:pentraxin-related protein PTX3-like isoform X2 [Myxocyprinus asiaticus]|uniref:pentraxin-related protein PTX3-like isoform X2 n=1 Tax=Myxocyprinus asiaticus TaxID=70543 RepID=UPI002222A502|nr:pentraxin-related protein PTX3-like isoform X2 [Myxocyprinus asiaticus]